MSAGLPWFARNHDRCDACDAVVEVPHECPHADEGPEEVCGETFDHDPVVVDERDGERAYWCRHCGAEIIEPSE